MNNETEIRRLTPVDVGLMLEMLSVFGRAFEDAARYTACQPADAYLRSLLANADFMALAALSEGRVVAGVTAYVLPKYERAGSEVYLYDLAVDEPFRRRGIATSLIHAVQREAQARGASVVYVQADTADEPAVALYSRLGEPQPVWHFNIREVSHSHNLSAPTYPHADRPLDSSC